MNVFNQVPSSNCFGLCHDSDSDSRFPPARIFRDGNQLMDQEESLEQEDQQKKKEMDDLLSKAMADLSLEERKRQEDILHGNDETTEDAAMVDRALQELDAKLSLIKQNSMYEVAERINPNYVNARAFRVMFLRANDYDATSAAEQMLRFFESKYQLFGIEKLVEEITLGDFDEEDIACLKAGCIQLAGKDKSGRQIFAQYAGLMDNLKSWMRIQYFLKMKALEDEETQLRGTVTLWWADGALNATANGKFSIEAFKASTALPQKRQVIHVCMNDKRYYLLSNTLIKLIKGSMRTRIRFHCGSPIECQYQLSAYGIRPQSLAVDSKGKMELKRYLDWIQSCMESVTISRSVQPRAAVMDGITTPAKADVLFSGGKVANHDGNDRFHSEIQNYSQTYDGVDRETRRQIVTTIIEKIHESGGRFLQQRQMDAGTVIWGEVPHDDLRTKIMQAFRNRRKVVDASKRKADDSDGATLIAGGPLPNDVLFGRVQRNPGTEFLHLLIKENIEEYESLGRGMKMRLVESIMQTLQDQGGARFLSPAGEPGRWLELSNNTARERISKCFRNYRRPPKINLK